MTQQHGFFIDTVKCTGCKTCELACKDYKDLDSAANFRRIYEYTGGDWHQDENGCWIPDIFAYYISMACNHCNNPACVSVCPTGAMHKRDDGFVLVAEDICIGCRHCESACPYGAPQYNAEKRNMTKCDGCYERVGEGKQPICVESCPLRAIDFGPMDELTEKYGYQRDIAPLPPSDMTQPNLIVRLNANAKPTGSQAGTLANPQEV